MAKKTNPTEATEEKDAIDIASLPKNILNAITKVATRVAVAEFDRLQRERRAAEKDFRLKNTRLLIKKYRQLKDFVGNAVSDLTQLLDEEDLALLEAMGCENLKVNKVNSIKDRVIFTNTVIGHIETMLSVYKSKCKSSPKEEVKRRWRVLDAMYLAEEASTPEVIAEAEHISDRMVYRDIEAAVRDISNLFFGLELSDILIV